MTLCRHEPHLMISASGGRTWAKSFPYARLLSVDGAAHAALWEDNEVVMNAIRTFVLGAWPPEAEIIK